MERTAALVGIGLAFVLGVGAGVFVIAPKTTRPAADADSERASAEATASRDDGPLLLGTSTRGASESAPSDAAAPPDRAAPGAASPPLASRMADFQHTLRRRVTEAGREALGSELPEDYVAEAIRRTEEQLEPTPRNWAQRLALREVARRAMGELGDPWTIVIEARAPQSLRVDVSEVPNPKYRERLGLTDGALDVTSAVVPNEPTHVHWVGGVVPVGKTAVLESIEFEGVFPAQGAGWGRAQLQFSGVEIPEQRGPGAVHTRYVGFHPARSWGGDTNLSFDFYGCAGRFTIRGRLVSEAEATSMRATRFHFAPEGSDGWLTSGRVTLQVAAGHVGGNPCSIDLLGTKNGYVDSVSPTPVWNDTVDVAKQSRATAYAGDAGAVPPGKAFRVRRVDWRARFGSPQSHSGFKISAGGQALVELKGEELATPGARGESANVSRSGVWTGDVLVRAGGEEQAALTCSYYVLGEAIFDGELVDEPK